VEPFRADPAGVTGLTQRRYADPSNRPFMRINLGGVQHLGNALSVGGRTRSLIGYVRSAQWPRWGAARVIGEVGAAQGIC